MIKKFFIASAEMNNNVEDVRFNHNNVNSGRSETRLEKLLLKSMNGSKSYDVSRSNHNELNIKEDFYSNIVRAKACYCSRNNLKPFFWGKEKNFFIILLFMY